MSHTARLGEYVSPSRLALWLRCPRAFELRYIDGRTSEPTPALLLGKAVHGILEHIYRRRMHGVPLTDTRWHEDARAVGTEPMRADVAVSPDEAAELCQQAEAMVRRYLQETPDEQPLAVELPLREPLIDPRTGEDLGMPLFGIIDLVLEDQRQPRIVDFKTAARAGKPSPLAHELQLTAYAYLVRRHFGRVESGCEIRRLIKTKTPQLAIDRYPPRTDRQIDQLFDLIREYLDGLAKHRFNPRPSWQCETCEHVRHCTDSLTG